MSIGSPPSSKLLRAEGDGKSSSRSISMGQPGFRGSSEPGRAVSSTTGVARGRSGEYVPSRSRAGFESEGLVSCGGEREAFANKDFSSSWFASSNCWRFCLLNFRTKVSTLAISLADGRRVARRGGCSIRSCCGRFELGRSRSGGVECWSVVLGALVAPSSRVPIEELSVMSGQGRRVGPGSNHRLRGRFCEIRWSSRAGIGVQDVVWSRLPNTW